MMIDPYQNPPPPPRPPPPGRGPPPPPPPIQIINLSIPTFRRDTSSTTKLGCYLNGAGYRQRRGGHMYPGTHQYLFTNCKLKKTRVFSVQRHWTTRRQRWKSQDEVLQRFSPNYRWYEVPNDSSPFPLSTTYFRFLHLEKFCVEYSFRNETQHLCSA